MEHHKSLMFFQRYVDQLVLFVFDSVNRVFANCRGVSSNRATLQVLI